MVSIVEAKKTRKNEFPTKRFSEIKMYGFSLVIKHAHFLPLSQLMENADEADDRACISM